MSESNKQSRLGRGLSSIFNRSNYSYQSNDNLIQEIDINLIKTNPFQPRTNISKKELEELANSIQAYGLIQPITVRKFNDTKYELISGERRLQASMLAGLLTIPVFIKNIQNNQMLEVALVENIQRQDLDAIEIAISLKQLIKELSDFFQQNIKLKIAKNGKGKIEIPFQSEKKLDEIIRILYS